MPLFLFALTTLLLLAPGYTYAQRGARGGDGQPGPPPTAKAAAPIDITGYWVSLVTDNWIFRVITPAKSDYRYLPINPEGRRVADTWDPAKDEAEGNACKAYGAPGIMRLPTHLHITWQDENTLKLEADYGTQTRLFHFGPPADAGRLDYSNATFFPPQPAKVEPPAGVAPSGQGYSMASWTIMGGNGNFERGGSLKVITTRLTPGYYWKNGMPYSGNAALTEYFRVMELPDRSQWIRFTQIVDDPDYLTQPWIVNYAFKKLADGSKWSLTPCSVK